MIAVSPQLADKSRTLIERHKLQFEILRDPRNDVAAAYGLRWSMPEDLKALYLSFGIDLAASSGEDSWTLPMPARYIIDAAGTIRYARTNSDYTVRPEPDDTLQALRALGD